MLHTKKNSRALGNWDTIGPTPFNALFILELDQEQLKQKLNAVFNEREWRDHAALYAQLYTIAEAIKDENNGKGTAAFLGGKQPT